MVKNRKNHIDDGDNTIIAEEEELNGLAAGRLISDLARSIISDDPEG
jgi:hypothetical protein